MEKSHTSQIQSRLNVTITCRKSNLFQFHCPRFHIYFFFMLMFLFVFPSSREWNTNWHATRIPWRVCFCVSTCSLCRVSNYGSCLWPVRVVHFLFIYSTLADSHWKVTCCTEAMAFSTCSFFFPGVMNGCGIIEAFRWSNTLPALELFAPVINKLPVVISHYRLKLSWPVQSHLLTTL